MAPRPEQNDDRVVVKHPTSDSSPSSESNKRLKLENDVGVIDSTTENVASSSAVVGTKIPSLSNDENEYAIKSLQNLIKYETVSATGPETGEYKRCALYLEKELYSLDVLSNIHFLKESPENSPVVVACWEGINKELPVLLLNSHYDVVPALNKDWNDDTPPFDGVRKDNKIYGRGTQDMKCVCIQYIESIRKILQMYGKEYKPQRSIYLTFVPDEEIGGSGMAAFLDSNLYKEDIVKKCGGIALALDEGLASTNDTLSVFYGERLPWWIDVKATGNTGHGSRFIEHTAVEQIIELSKKALAFREGQRRILHGGEEESKHENCSHAVVAKKQKQKNANKTLGDVTTLNITTLQAGVRIGNTFAYNCVPPTAQCSMDIRISPHVEPKEISDMLNMWCQECSSDKANGHQLSWSYTPGQNGSDESLNDLQKHSLTSVDTTINPWYKHFTNALEKTMNLQIEPQVFPAATDSRFLRALGIRALGFSPMRNTEIMLHENNEYIPESTFLEGIGIYVGLIYYLSNVVVMDE